MSEWNAADDLYLKQGYAHLREWIERAERNDPDDVIRRQSYLGAVRDHAQALVEMLDKGKTAWHSDMPLDYIAICEPEALDEALAITETTNPTN